MNDSLLKNSVIAFEKLLDIEYLLEIGRKGKRKVFRIVFDGDDFKHLSGIGKLEDLELHKQPANIIFRNAVIGKLTDKDLIVSSYFDRIVDRLENLKNLEYYLDNNMMVFKWDKNTAKSSIVADYMLEENHSSKPIAYVFVKEKTGALGINKLKVCEITKESGVSFFRSNNDYSVGQIKYTLLKNEKLHKTTGYKDLLFDFKMSKHLSDIADEVAVTDENLK